VYSRVLDNAVWQYQADVTIAGQLIRAAVAIGLPLGSVVLSQRWLRDSAEAES
jgi:hypothetical protein